jgi:hypothetical protein
MKVLQTKGKPSLKKINSFLLLKYLIVLLILSISISIQNVSAAEEIYKVAGPASDKSPYIRLINVVTRDVLYLPIKNFTVADYDLLNNIKFKLSKIDPTDLDTLQIQAIYYGAGWINNVNRTSTNKIRALRHAANENIGMWSSEFIKGHISRRTYAKLKASLKRIHIVLKDYNLISADNKNKTKYAHNKDKKRTKKQPENGGCQVAQNERVVILIDQTDRPTDKDKKVSNVDLGIIIAVICMVLAALPFFGISRFRINSTRRFREVRTNSILDGQTGQYTGTYRTTQYRDGSIKYH